jgi:hypothetical protein
MSGLEMSVVPYESYKEAEREVQRLRSVVITLEDEVAKLRDMASTLWNYTACLRWPSVCNDDQDEPCKVCAAGRVVESWEE